MKEAEKVYLIETTIYQVAINLMAIANGGNIQDFDPHAVAFELLKTLEAKS